MDEEIRQVIERIYIEKVPNMVITPEFIDSLSNDFSQELDNVKGISYEIIKNTHDREYKNIEYGETCVIALDIFVSIPQSKSRLAIQISKLGKFARIYWKKNFLIIGASYSGVRPKKWPEELTLKIIEIIKKIKLRLISDDELYERIQEIDDSIDGQKASVEHLLFCFDGPH